MIWKPGGKYTYTYIYVMFKKGVCTAVGKEELYDSDYQQREASREGLLLAPKELAKWLD
jgi:hypothetical protein